MTGKASGTGLKTALRAGLAARQRGDRQAAERIFREILGTHPGQPDALNLLGVLMAECGRPEDAVDLLTAAAAARPQSDTIPLNLAQALLAANRAGEAASILHALSAAQKPDIRVQHLLAGTLLADRRPREAAAIARRALKSRPHDPELLTLLGDALVQSDRPADALPHYEAAIAAMPTNASIYNNLGTALEKLGRLTEAAAAFEQALRRAPHHTGARTNLGTVRLRLGEADAADAEFDRVLNREPHNQRAIAYRFIARQEAGAMRPEEARAHLAPLIHEEFLSCPDSFRSLTDFNATLAAELYAHPARRQDVSGTATTGGFDALRLFDHNAPALNAFEGRLRSALDRHIAGLHHEAGHPFLGRQARAWTLDVWATFLKSGGYQFPHIHPSGWISGVYYVQVPAAVSSASADQEGWIEFNRPDESFDYTFQPEVLLKQPRAGLLLLFPSYAYHRTIPFESGTDRISIAFDVKPAR